jgi:hypothetical protein
MLDFLLGDLTGYMIGAVAVVGAVLGVYIKGRGDGRAKMNRDLDQAYIETRERIDDAETFTEYDDARDFLVERLQRKTD